MSTVLVVEDSPIIYQTLSHRLKLALDCEVDVAATRAEAARLLDSGKEYSVAILDLSLPDASGDDIVDLVHGYNVPSIVFTGEVTQTVRDLVWSKGVVDYVEKLGPESVIYVVRTVANLRRNRSIEVLVVDDSQSYRRYAARLLRAHQFNVLEAESGEAALAFLREHQDVRLVLTDYEMGGMDGCQLVRTIRRQGHPNRLAVIGVSSARDKNLSARFIKAGADDFIHKPFTAEEFYCRVGLNLEIIEKIDALEKVSRTDALTGLCNRRRFFELARLWYEGAVKRGAPFTVAMADIDHFKKINDTYGHDVGDVVLTQVAALLQDAVPAPNLVARLGGEEFAIVLRGPDPAEAAHTLETLCAKVAEVPFETGGKPIPVSVSIGGCSYDAGGLDAMLREADLQLYEAKQTGRNRVLVTSQN